jgi:hypothetical protein
MTTADDLESEVAIPEPPGGAPAEVARRAWQVAWSASNASASYHASVIKHVLEHEKKILAEVRQMRLDVAKDFDSFRKTIVAALAAVGIHVTLSASGEHAAATLGAGVLSEAPRERVASSHDLEEGFQEMGEQIEERFRELRDHPGERTSDRMRELLTQERARQEAEAQILRLELDKKTMELAHAQEVKRLGDQKAEYEQANVRWQRVAFLVGGGVVTVLGGLLLWALTRQAPSLLP